MTDVAPIAPSYMCKCGIALGPDKDLVEVLGWVQDHGHHGGILVAAEGHDGIVVDAGASAMLGSFASGMIGAHTARQRLRATGGGEMRMFSGPMAGGDIDRRAIEIWLDRFKAAEMPRRRAMLTALAWRSKGVIDAVIDVLNRHLSGKQDGDIAIIEDLIVFTTLAFVPPHARQQLTTGIVQYVLQVVQSPSSDVAEALRQLLRRALERTLTDTYSDGPRSPHPFEGALGVGRPQVSPAMAVGLARGKPTPKDAATPEEKRMLTALLDAFGQLGPVESLDWFCTYFDEDFTAAMAEHGHPADPWTGDLTREVQALVVKYRAKRG